MVDARAQYVPDAVCMDFGNGYWTGGADSGQDAKENGCDVDIHS